jgi:hypothetical protein
MTGIRSVLSTTAIIAGGGLALLTGGIAKADPAAPTIPMPNVPGMNVVEQLVDPAKAPQLLQSAAALLTSPQVTPATPATPLTPPPMATASLNVPQPTLPGMPGALPTDTLATGMLPDGSLPVGTMPASTAAATEPGASLTLPQVPGLPVPLPQQVSVPTEVTSFLTGTSLTPAQAAATASGSPAAASPGTAPLLTSLFPTNALP